MYVTVLSSTWEDVIETMKCVVRHAIATCELADMVDEWVALQQEYDKMCDSLGRITIYKTKWTSVRLGCFPLTHKWADLQGKMWV